MKLKCAVLSALALIGFSSGAQAYDVDTHFYATYAMARYTGIRHEVATQIALSTQWMDESYISDPTSMIFMPITGIKKRRLLHFPSSRVVGMVGNSTEMNTIGGIPLAIEQMIAKEANRMGVQNRLNDLQFMTETVEDHPFASELLMEGLKTGNLMMAGAGLHTLEDSFAHAGTTAEQGHAFIWHWPDRPFASPEKYMRMSHAVIRALVAIRKLLPSAALDCSLKLAPIPSTVPNCQMDAATLGDNYAATAAISQVISYDVLKDPEFVRTALVDLVSRSIKAGYIKKSHEALVAMFRGLPIDGAHDSEEVAEVLMQRLITEEFTSNKGSVNIRLILSDMGRLPADASPALIRAYVQSFGSKELFHSLAQDLLRWKVPTPLSDTHRVELEDDKSAIRDKEMELRTKNIQALIRNLYGVQLVMIENPTKDDAGFDREILMDPTAEAKIKVDREIAYVTMSLAERNAFDNMIFTFLFPSLTTNDLRTLITKTAAIKTQTKNFSKIKAAYDAYLAERDSIKADKTLNVFSRGVELLKLDHNSGFFTQSSHYIANTAAFAKTMTQLAFAVKPMIPLMLKDTMGSRLTPSPDNFFYRDDGLFQAYINARRVKPLLGANDKLWSIGLLKEKARMQAGRPPAQL